MKVLVVGSDGRGHALAWALRGSPSVDEVHSLPGHPGQAAIGPTVAIDPSDLGAVADYAQAQRIDLTVVSPEAPLVAGVADVLAARGLAVFGPSRAAAEIEGSKVFCRDLARRHGVPTAEGESFDDPEAAADYARTISPPLVVKADGLAAGKGVLICRDHTEATEAIDRIMRQQVFGGAGGRVIVEEFLEGRETSMFCLTDGATKVFLEPAQDYKRALDADQGANTGGMGAYSPVPWLDPDERTRAMREVVEPLIDGLAAEGRPYSGCFYAGLMFTAKGPRLIEVNCRFGDPETQVLVRRLDTDLGELLRSCADGTLGSPDLAWRPEAAVCVVVASGGYPGTYATGVDVSGIDAAEEVDDVVVFHAATARKDGRLVSSGGRVLNVTATGPTIAAARDRAYEAAERIQMDGKQYRTDIAAGVA